MEEYGEQRSSSYVRILRDGAACVHKIRERAEFRAWAMRLPAYPSSTTRKDPCHAACRPSEAILAALRARLCTILHPNFRESIFHALR